MRCFRTEGRVVGAECTFVGHLARYRIVGGDLSATQGDWLVRFKWNFVWWYLGWNEEPTLNFRPLKVVWRVNLCFKKTAKVSRLPAEFHIGMAVDVVLRLGWNFLWEIFLVRGTSPQNFARFAPAIWKMLQNRGGVVGASCMFRGHLALSKRTSLGHKKIGSCIFSQILYGGSWVGMRSPHKISPNRRSFGGWTRVSKNCQGLEVTEKISKWNGRRWGALIGLKFCVATFLG